jgi:hypothetical protein
MALSSSPRTSKVPREAGVISALQDERTRAIALSLAAEDNPAIRAALLPYPSPFDMDVLATAFGVKRKVRALF